MNLDFVLYKIEGFARLMNLKGNTSANRGEKEENVSQCCRKGSLRFHLPKKLEVKDCKS